MMQRVFAFLMLLATASAFAPQTGMLHENVRFVNEGGGDRGSEERQQLSLLEE